MGVLPDSRAAVISWFEARLPVWAADPPAIGLTAVQVSDLSSATSAARSALTEQTNAINAKLSATSAMHSATDTLRSLGSELIKTIKNFAELTNDPGVYDAAQVPAPQPPTPAGPPPQPTELSAGILLPYGISLSWKGSTAQSAYFAIYRQLPGAGSFSLIDTTKEKRYEDTSLPTGVASVQYYIAAIREGFQVNSAALSVQFGPGGSMTMSLAA